MGMSRVQPEKFQYPEVHKTRLEVDTSLYDTSLSESARPSPFRVLSKVDSGIQGN